MDYLTLFQQHSEYSTYSESAGFQKPNVSHCVTQGDVHYTPPTPLEERNLTFTAIESGTFTLTIPSSVDTTYLTSVSYSLDEGETWTTTANSSSSVTITTPTVSAGNTVQWRGIGYCTNYNANCAKFSSTGNFSVSGNIRSLAPDGITGYPNRFSARSLFSNCTKLKSAKGLALSTVTDMTIEYCLAYLFQGCTGLIFPPKLPNTTLGAHCYDEMFSGCTSLTEAPYLPAETVPTYAYYRMFKNCTSLTEAPKLGATTHGEYSCCEMFDGCSGITSAPHDMLQALTLDARCYRYMFRNCTSLTSIPELPASTLALGCYGGMYYGCTGITTVPANYLHATTLITYCYYQMFYGCSGMTSAPNLPAETLADSCYEKMFTNCSSLTTAPVLPAVTLVRWCYEQLFKGCSSLNYIKAMFTSTPNVDYNTSNWVNGVAATGTFVKNSAATWTTTGANGVPSGWTVQTASA